MLKGWPRLSESFIAQELAALEARGFALQLISLRRPTDRATHPVHREVKAPVLYLPEYLHDSPLRVLRAWRRALGQPGWRTVWRLFRADLKRDPSRNRVRRFGQALVLAAEADPAIELLYAHFLHTPASVARYAAALLGLDWAVSAHAKDIWTTPDWDIAGKLADSAWAVTCSAAGKARLDALAPAGKPVLLAYHGLDAARFPTAPIVDRPAGPVTLLSVGRAVEKKGHADLLQALARLPSELDWRLVHIGGGVLAEALQAQAAALGLAGRIDWRGAQPLEAVLAAYRAADLFVLASRIAADGDRDGLPNVLMEAQSQGLACLSTRVSAVPELIEDGVTGLLVEPGNVAALSAALARLIGDPALRRRLGVAGAARVARDFAFGPGIDRIAMLLAEITNRPGRRAG
ncbi:MAG: glycosyltransferase family 4 protein [Aliidongia sp.]